MREIKGKELGFMLNKQVREMNSRSLAPFVQP